MTDEIKKLEAEIAALDVLLQDRNSDLTALHEILRHVHSLTDKILQQGNAIALQMTIAMERLAALQKKERQ